MSNAFLANHYKQSMSGFFINTQTLESVQVEPIYIWKVRHQNNLREYESFFTNQFQPISDSDDEDDGFFTTDYMYKSIRPAVSSQNAQTGQRQNQNQNQDQNQEHDDGDSESNSNSTSLTISLDPDDHSFVQNNMHINSISPIQPIMNGVIAQNHNNQNHLPNDHELDVAMDIDHVENTEEATSGHELVTHIFFPESPVSVASTSTLLASSSEYYNSNILSFSSESSESVHIDDDEDDEMIIPSSQ